MTAPAQPPDFADDLAALDDRITAFIGSRRARIEELLHEIDAQIGEIRAANLAVELRYFGMTLKNARALSLQVELTRKFGS